MSFNGWENGKLGDIAEIIMGQSPKGETCYKEEVGVPLLNGPTEFGRSYPKAVQWTTDARKECRTGDILFCVRGSTTGRMNWADTNYAIGRGIAAIRHKNRGIFNPYIKGILEYKLDAILASATGSTFPNVGKELLTSLPIKIPSEMEQKAIAATLSCLDDMSELNNRTNEVLEEMAQAIFKHWFVDFEFPNENGEPYKSSGGEMVGSELGEIPRGWELGVLRDILVLNYGKSLPAKNRNAGKIKVFSSAGVTGYHDIPLVSEPSIIVGRKGTIGTVYYCEEPSFCIDTAYYTTQNDCKYPLLIAYQLLKNLNLNIYNEDSAVPGLNRNTVYAIKIAIPPDHILNWCNDVISLIHNFVFKNNYSNNSLAKIRDTLLPKLMSGEIRVPIEEVG